MTSCATCELPLVLEIESHGDDHVDSPMRGGASTTVAHMVPDDVQMSCGCHFHWQCLLSAYQILQCPSCASNISSISTTGDQQILCTLHNEGGLQTDLDILPLLTEEIYLKAYPEERRARAFLEFCREGDVEAIIGLLKKATGDSDSDDEDEEEEDEEDGDEDEEGLKLTPAQILLYQDPTGTSHSGLHIAVLAGQIEVIYLLLLLGAPHPGRFLPTDVVVAADRLGAVQLCDRLGVTIDIRSLKDAEGKLALDYFEMAGLDGRLGYIEPEILEPQEVLTNTARMRLWQ
ncbi:hypothetical protein MMC30_009419 [Trapelia coarctata]|nr:hypothetical protein [Trapelia coarctata]